MHVRIANREDPDQTASSEAYDLGLPGLCKPFWQAISVQHFFMSRHVRKANREDPDQTTSDWVSTVWLSHFGRQLVYKISEHLL